MTEPCTWLRVTDAETHVTVLTLDVTDPLGRLATLPPGLYTMTVMPQGVERGQALVRNTGEIILNIAPYDAPRMN